MSKTKRQETAEQRLTRLRECGRRGGMKNRDRQLAKDPYYFEKLGELGGEATRLKYQDGPDHWAIIGQMGSENLMAKHGPEYHHRLGKLSWERKLRNTAHKGGL